MSKDYYKILGVSKNATKDEISKAYKSLAKKYHPDINKEPGAVDKFKEVNAAYEVLSDDSKRSNYDNFGSADGGGFGGFGGQGFGGQGFGQGFGGFGQSDDLGDFFSEMFGFGGRKGKANNEVKGQDIQIVLTISLEDAFNGLKGRSFKINTFEKCGDCNGKGGTGSQVSCTDCKGTGMKASSHGFISFASTCSSCGGSGRNIANSCKKCHGEGRNSVNKSIEIDIPAGVDNGMTIKYKGLGDVGLRNGGSGDLLVSIQIKEHSIFQRHGDDLVIEKKINLKQMICGDKIKIKGIDGKDVEIEIPSNSSPYDSITISKTGMSKYNGGRGNLVIKMKLESIKLNKEFINEFKNMWNKYN